MSRSSSRRSPFWKGRPLAFICGAVALYVLGSHFRLWAVSCPGVSQILKVADIQNQGTGKQLKTSHDGLHPTVSHRPALQDAIESYAKFLADLVRDNPERLTERFIAWKRPSAGLGNRVMSFTSTFMLAFITKRPLLADWDGDDYGAVRSLFLPLDPQLFFLMGEAAKIVGQEKIDEIMKIEPMMSRTKSELYGVLGCSANLDADLPPRFLLESDQYYLPLLSHNPNYVDQFRELFDPFRMFESIYQVLFHPLPDVVDRVRSYKAQHFSEYTIGLQIRMREHAFLKEGQQRLFWQCAKALTETVGKGRNTTYFLAADRDATKEMARQVFGSKVFFVDDAFSRKTVAGLRAALVDIYLLGECDDLILSTSSTFGAIAAARGGRAPLVVTTQDMCIKMLYAEPPFHYAPDYFPLGKCFNKEAPSMYDMVNRWIAKP